MSPDIFAIQRLYGTDPAFVCDPVKSTNRPMKGYLENVIIYRSLCPERLEDLFTHALTQELASPGKRVTEKQWLDVFVNLMRGIVRYPHCGVEVFYDEEKTAIGVGHVCRDRGRAVKMPFSLAIEKCRMLFTPDTKLDERHIRETMIWTPS